MTKDVLVEIFRCILPGRIHLDFQVCLRSSEHSRKYFYNLGPFTLRNYIAKYLPSGRWVVVGSFISAIPTFHEDRLSAITFAIRMAKESHGKAYIIEENGDRRMLYETPS